MLRYEPLQLSLGGMEYMLLPKLIPQQLAIVSRRLSRVGFVITEGNTLTGRRPGQTISVSSAGLCWSNRDPMDAIAPAIPDVLHVGRQPTRPSAVLGMYLRVRRGGGKVSLHFFPRLESGPSWTKLRRADASGLSPDELSVMRFALSAGRGRCEMVTDFPVEGSAARTLGNRQYYTSPLECSRAADTLRPSGHKQERNSYLPSSGSIVLGSMKLPSLRGLTQVLRDLGEWCYFTPR